MISVLQVVCLACFGILPFMLYAITSLGAGILFEIIWQFAFLGGFDLAKDFTLGVALIEIALIPMTFFMVFLLRQHVDLRLGALLGIPAALTSLIGVEVLVTFNDTWLRRGLGMMLLVTYVSLIFKRRLAKPEKFSKPVTAYDLLTWQTFLVSVITGIGCGLFSIGGPPLMLWASLYKVPKDLCRANVCTCFAIQYPVTVFYMLVVKKVWRNEDLPYYLIFVGGSLFGLVLGTFVAKWLNEKRFQVLLIYVILMAGGLFISTNVQPILMQAMVSSICLVIGIGVGLVLLGKEPPQSQSFEGTEHLLRTETETSKITKTKPLECEL